MPNGQAVNILLDATCSMQFSLTDQGGGESFSNTISFKADKVTVRESVSSSNHATNQDPVAAHRKGQIDWEINVETKLYNSTLLGQVRGNDLGRMIVTVPGFGVDGRGLITDVEVDYAGPSTIKWTIKAHGTALQYV
jgi:hypothetical protein